MNNRRSTVAAKQPIKRLEIPINKFNDVAIPHHLDLLKRHKNNIKKYQKMGNWESVRKEQINAARLTKQLEQLLYEMDTLRTQVRDEDISIFDGMTAKSRAEVLAAIEECLELKFEPILSLEAAAALLPPKDADQTVVEPLEQLQISFDAQQEDLERQNVRLQAWNALRQDLQQLHELFVDFNKTIEGQREQIDSAESNVVETDTNVRTGIAHLERASKYKAATYPLIGALCGACLGGPAGLVAGAKLGGLAAIGGGLLGFTAASLLKKSRSTKERPDDEVEMRKRDWDSGGSINITASSRHGGSAEPSKKRS